jgi:hypothetical protein
MNNNKFRFWALQTHLRHFRSHKVYFFELSIKFYIKSSHKTKKLVFFTCQWKRSEKIVWELPDGICFWDHKWKLIPVRPISSVLQKEKSLTWKHFSKFVRTKFSFGQPWNRARRQTAERRKLFFRKSRFLFDKKS